MNIWWVVLLWAAVYMVPVIREWRRLDLSFKDLGDFGGWFMVAMVYFLLPILLWTGWEDSEGRRWIWTQLMWSVVATGALVLSGLLYLDISWQILLLALGIGCGLHLVLPIVSWVLVVVAFLDEDPAYR